MKYVNDENEKKSFKNIHEIILDKSIYIIVDSNILKMHDGFFSIFDNFNVKGIYSFKASEKNKSIDELSSIVSEMTISSVNRDDLLIVVGGGITTDIGGFIASVYKRGIEWISIPTTLLGMVDASIGGKTAINTKEGKNLLGSFHLPLEVFIRLEFLSTLQKIDVYSGIGEILKMSMLISNNLFSKLKNDILSNNFFEHKNMHEYIDLCIDYKMSLVKDDFKDEKNKRIVLNLGHTIAHAIERASNNKIQHGIAVLYGIDFSLYMSKKFAGFSSQKYQEYNLFLQSLEFTNKLDIKISNIQKYISVDKKIKNNLISFILLKDYGFADILKISSERLNEELGIYLTTSNLYRLR